MEQRFRYREGDALVPGHEAVVDFLTRTYPFAVPSGVMFRGAALRPLLALSDEYGFCSDLALGMSVCSMWDLAYIDEPLSSWRYTPECHTARLHRDGMDVQLFYDLADHFLPGAASRMWFNSGNFTASDKLRRDAAFFCTCRALLNVIAAVRGGNVRLLWRTVRTVAERDPCLWNWLRLPLWAVRQVFA